MRFPTTTPATIVDIKPNIRPRGGTRLEDEPSFFAGFVSEPGMYDPIEVWEEFLAEMQAIPALLLKEQIIAKAKRVIEEGREALRAKRYWVRRLH